MSVSVPIEDLLSRGLFFNVKVILRRLRFKTERKERSEPAEHLYHFVCSAS